MIQFSRPYIDEDIIKEVVETLRSGWISTGPKTREFESELQKYTSAKRVLCVNSAASGLQLMLKWFGIQEGDEVIVPAMTHCATAHAVVHAGATPVMVDVSNDYNIDVSLLEKAITTKTKVIIPVDMAGLPASYGEIFSLVNSQGILSRFNPVSKEQEKLGRILILADAAHSLGAIYNGKPCGSIPDAAVYSFHAVKNITTAEGGAIALNLNRNFDIDSEYDYLRKLSLHGQDKDAFLKVQSGSWQHDVPYAGFKCNMPDVLAAIGLAQLRKYDSEILPARKDVFSFYQNRFLGIEWAELSPHKNDVKETSYHLFFINIKGIDEDKRNTIVNDIYSKGVMVNVQFIPLPMLSYYKPHFDITHFPCSYNLFSTQISLPVYPGLSSTQLDFITKTVISSVENNI